jgi:hypothetical protein
MLKRTNVPKINKSPKYRNLVKQFHYSGAIQADSSAGSRKVKGLYIVSQLYCRNRINAYNFL